MTEPLLEELRAQWHDDDTALDLTEGLALRLDAGIAARTSRRRLLASAGLVVLALAMLMPTRTPTTQFIEPTLATRGTPDIAPATATRTGAGAERARGAGARLPAVPRLGIAGPRTVLPAQPPGMSLGSIPSSPRGAPRMPRVPS